MNHDTHSAVGFPWWWQERDGGAQLIVVRPYAAMALVGVLAFVPDLGWWPLLAAALALPFWARLTIDEDGARVVDYWLFVPWSRRALQAPVDVVRDEGIDYESDGILVQSTDDHDEIFLWGRHLYRLVPRIRQVLQRWPSANR